MAVPSTPPRTTFCWMPLPIVKLNRDFHSAGDIQRGSARVYLPDHDDAGVGNLLAILAIEDGHAFRTLPQTWCQESAQGEELSMLPKRRAWVSDCHTLTVRSLKKDA